MPSAMIALALSFLALASASPVAVQSTCSPNLGSTLGVSIVNGVRELGFASSPPSNGTLVVAEGFNINTDEFDLTFTGAPANDFLITPVGSTNLSVSASGLGLQIATTDSTDPTQSFNIVCVQCDDPTAGIFTFGCTITPAGDDSLCVEIDTAITLQTCNGNANQVFALGTSGDAL